MPQFSGYWMGMDGLADTLLAVNKYFPNNEFIVVAKELLITSSILKDVGLNTENLIPRVKIDSFTGLPRRSVMKLFLRHHLFRILYLIEVLSSSGAYIYNLVFIVYAMSVPFKNIAV